jgi:hypothetical protein
MDDKDLVHEYTKIRQSVLPQMQLAWWQVQNFQMFHPLNMEWIGKSGRWDKVISRKICKIHNEGSFYMAAM